MFDSELVGADCMHYMVKCQARDYLPSLQYETAPLSLCKTSTSSKVVCVCGLCESVSAHVCALVHIQQSN